MSAHKKKHKRVKTGSSTSMFGAALKGGAIGLLLSVLLAVVIALCILGAADPDALVFPLSLAALYVSAFVSGFVASKINGGGELPSGGLAGLVFMLSYMLVCLFFPTDLSARYGFFVAVFFRALIVIIAILGGYAASARPQKKHRPRR